MNLNSDSKDIIVRGERSHHEVGIKIGPETSGFGKIAASSQTIEPGEVEQAAIVMLDCESEALSFEQLMETASPPGSIDNYIGLEPVRLTRDVGLNTPDPKRRLMFIRDQSGYVGVGNQRCDFFLFDVLAQ
jgi:hypothetical protein